MSSLRRVFACGLVSVCLFASATAAAGQGVQAGTVSGVVQSIDTLPLPGVTVTATSPNLQGERLAVSDENGVYYLRGLLPGTYSITFDIPGFQPASREEVQVGVGGLAVVDATMSLAGVTRNGHGDGGSAVGDCGAEDEPGLHEGARLTRCPWDAGRSTSASCRRA